MPRTARRTARRPTSAKGGAHRCLGRTKGGRKAKLHAGCDGEGSPVVLLLTEGQASDHRGAALLLHKLAPARERIPDHGQDSRRFCGEFATCASSFRPAAALSSRSTMSPSPSRPARCSAHRPARAPGADHEGRAPHRRPARPRDRRHLPGSADHAEPALHHRPAARGDDDDASADRPGRGAPPRDRAAVACRHRGSGVADRQLLARILWRHAPARGDRARALCRTEAGYGGRADDRAPWPEPCAGHRPVAVFGGGEGDDVRLVTTTWA